MVEALLQQACKGQVPATFQFNEVLYPGIEPERSRLREVIWTPRETSCQGAGLFNGRLPVHPEIQVDQRKSLAKVTKSKDRRGQGETNQQKPEWGASGLHFPSSWQEQHRGNRFARSVKDRRCRGAG